MPASSPPASSPQPLTVSELTRQVKESLESTFPRVWVEGEVTDLVRARSGHLYFTLKDDRAQLRGIVWRSTAARLPFRLENGQAVICFGDLEVYAARGTYQLVVRRAEPQGVGGLQLAFEQLKRALTAEGLFAVERKRALPSFPRRLGFVTSPSGAAIRDFLEIAQRRSPAIQIVVIPATVQGRGAASTIAAGIAAAQRLFPPLDVLVVGRGGGSLEDLWCFNEEAVVRAIAGSHLPIVSAVGHEVDVTLADLAADRRAATPSEAAELLVPSADELRDQLQQTHRRLLRPLQHQLRVLRGRLDAIASRPLFVRPHQSISDWRHRLDDLDLRSKRAVLQHTAAARQRLRQATATLEAYSPLAVLQRGYSVTQRAGDGEPLRNAEDLQVGDRLTTRLHRGQVISRVERTEPSS